MAFISFTRKSLSAALFSLALTACSYDGFVPPERIDNGVKVSSIPRARARAVETQTQRGYAAPATPVVTTSDDYLNTPNLAGTDPTASQQPSRSLPKIDSDEAMAGAQGAATGLARQPTTWGGAQPLAAPSGGVNMDAELGVAPVKGLAEEEQQQIAESGTEEPVVDGIGSQTPVAVKRSRLPEPQAGDEISSMPPQGTSREVAMLRPSNPMLDAPQTPLVPQAMPSSEIACRRELKRLGVDFVDKPPISQGPACQVPYPISLRGLSGNIDVKPSVTLNCQVTLAFAKWVKNDLAPAARTRYWSGIGRIEPMGGYSCRRMNNSRQRYNPMSEHAKGNAIDVGAIVLKNGHEIDIRKKGFFAFRERGLLKAVRSDSCQYFNTVLGPGSNPEHWNHFHFDLRDRASGKIYCD